MLLNEHLKNPLFGKVAAAAAGLNVPVYVVGGYVRDIFLDRPSKDIDFVVVGDGVEVASRFASALRGHHKVNIFRNFGNTRCGGISCCCTAIIRQKLIEVNQITV